MEGKNEEMKCEYHKREYFIEGYLSDTLTEAERDEFADHLFGCEACQKELQFREALKETIVREARDGRADVSVGAQSRWKFTGYAAAAVLAILVGIRNDKRRIYDDDV